MDTSSSGNKVLFGGIDIDSKGFKQLLDTQSLVDCTLACDGGKISAHKIVLSACSSYLAKILLEHPVEHPIIILPELSIEEVRTLVHYMYTGELLKSQTLNSTSLLRTAAILSVNSLNDLNISSGAAAVAAATSLSSPYSSPSSSSSSSASSPSSASSLSTATAATTTTTTSTTTNDQLQQQQQLASAFASATSPLEAAASIAALSRATTALNGTISSINNNNIHRYFGHNNLTSFFNSIARNTITNHNNISPPSGTSTSNNNLSNDNTNNIIMNAKTSSSSSNSSTSGRGGGVYINNNNNKSSVNTNHLVNKVKNGNILNHQLNLTSNKSNEFQFKCPVCQNDFQTICSFEYHMQRIHNVTSFGCEICQKPFASLRYVLTDHMRRCHGIKPNNVERKMQHC